MITDENLMFTHGHGIAEHVDGVDVREPSAFVKPFMEDRAPTLEAFMEDVRYAPDGGASASKVFGEGCPE